MVDGEIGADRLGKNGDAFYESLMRAHDGLDEDDSHALNIRLVLLMANQIADLDVLNTLIDAAKDGGK